jgi:hypothetical protein
MASRRLAADQKNAQDQQAVIAFIDESGFMLQPVRRRTWAPRGQTPIQYAWDRHDRLSAVSAITFSPKTQRPGVFFRLLDHNLRTPDCVDFLTELHHHVRRKVIVVWDECSSQCCPSLRNNSSRLVSVRMAAGVRSGSQPALLSIHWNNSGTTQSTLNWPT